MVSYNTHTQPGTLVHARPYMHTRTHASHSRALTRTPHALMHKARPTAIRGEFATIYIFRRLMWNGATSADYPFCHVILFNFVLHKI